jgi:hypothetical protein
MKHLILLDSNVTVPNELVSDFQAERRPASEPFEGGAR